MKEEGMHYFQCLYRIFTRGVEDYADDTQRRAKFVEDNLHLFAGTMLVGLFAFLESTLGKNWITRCGGRQKRELECLRFARNAFVHTNSHIRDLGTYSLDEEAKLRAFIQDIEAGRIRDDKGNAYASYMTLTDDGVVKFNEHAFNIFRAIGMAICH